MIATCDILLKFHQGTHSPDAFSNNVHELLLNQRRTASNGGQVTEARYNAMIPLGRPGGFTPSECPGFGRPFVNVKPAAPADSPSDTRSLGRLITEPGCVQAIREGRTHQDPLLPNPVPFTVSDMDDFWFSDISVTGSGLSFRIAPLFYVVTRRATTTRPSPTATAGSWTCATRTSPAAAAATRSSGSPSRPASRWRGTTRARRSRGRCVSSGRARSPSRTAGRPRSTPTCTAAGRA